MANHNIVTAFVVATGLSCGEPAPAHNALASPAATTSVIASGTVLPAGPEAPSPLPDASPSASAAQPAPARSPAERGTISGTVTSTPAGAAKHAVIYLEDGPTSKSVSATVDNHQMNFAPYVAVVTAGSVVTFLNQDPFPHNVFSPDHERWDIGQVPMHGSKTRKFEKSGAYTLLCNLHPNMKGYVVVVPSAAFAKADSSGAWSIKDMAPGTYKITAWAPGVQPLTRSVTVAGDVTVAFELKR